MDNRRLTDRYNLQIKTILSFTDSPTRKGTTLNISADGAFIVTAQPKPVGSKIYISLLADAWPSEQIRKKTVLKLAGSVRRTTNYGMAVCFDPCRECAETQLETIPELHLPQPSYYPEMGP